MQELNLRKENCDRFSDNAEQPTNCTQKSQRIRCCGRVLTEQEVSAELLRKKPGQGKRMANRQGQGKCMGSRQSQGKRKEHRQGHCQSQQRA